VNYSFKGVDYLKKIKNKKNTFADNLLTPMSSKISMSIKVFDENMQDFSPYNGLQWEPNVLRFKRQFQCKLQTVQRALNDSRQ